MGFAKPIEQYLFSNLLIRIHVFMYLKDIIRGMILMRILIYGAGVIGSLYATLFAEAGYEWL